MTTATRRRLIERLYPKFAGSPYSLCRGIVRLEQPSNTQRGHQMKKVIVAKVRPDATARKPVKPTPVPVDRGA